MWWNIFYDINSEETTVIAADNVDNVNNNNIANVNSNHEANYIVQLGYT